MNGSAPRRGRPAGSTGTELLAAAREVFLDHGYAGTTMDDVAARARISKTSLYREHPSKAELFAAVVKDWAGAGRHAMRPSLDRLEAAADVREGLLGWAQTLLVGILSPTVLEMRRLVIAEAARHPEVATDYLRESWVSNIQDLAATLQTLAARGLLRLTDPQAAAEQLTWLIVGAPLNAQLLGASTADTVGVDRAVELFISAHGQGR